MKSRLALPLLCMAFAASLAQAHVPPATQLVARFELRYGPFRPAEITLTGHEDAGSYAAEGHVASAGLLSLIRDFHFDLSVTGTRHQAEFRPDRFTGDLDTGRRSVQVQMTYPQGIPTIQSIAPPEPPGPWRIEARDQTGTIDPLSALYRIVRPRALDSLCDWSVEVYDGRRHSRLSLAPVIPDHDLMRCDGAYLRVAGYSPQELDNYRSLPFQLWFAPTAGDEWQLTRVVTHTPYGRMRINRLF